MRNPPFVTRYSPTSKEAEKLAYNVRFVRGADSKDRLAWAEHPDDAVVAALANTVWVRENYSTDGYKIRALLYLRGLEAARRDDVCWNPILDGISRSGLVTTPIDRHCMAQVISASPGVFTPLEQQLEPFRAWLEALTDPRDLDPVLKHFRSGLLFRLVATHGPVDVQRAGALLDRSHDLALHLVKNGRLDSRTASFIGQWALERIFDPQGKKATIYGEALNKLDRLGMRPVAREEIERLMSAATETRIDRKRTLLSPERAIDALVRLRRHLSKEDLLRLIPATKHRGSYVAGLATAPAADEELVLYALDTSRTITLKIALANHPKFRLLPSVRRRLLDSMERSITRALLATSQDRDERRKILRHRLKKDPRFGLALLHESPKLIEDLKPIDLTPALRHDLGDIRERAIEVLAQMGTSTGTVANLRPDASMQLATNPAPRRAL